MKKIFFAFVLVFSLGFCFAENEAEVLPVEEAVATEEIEENEDSEESEAVLETEDQTESIPETDLWWQGKVAFAKENEFPQGIFAAVKGYLPGDTLSVMNNKTMKAVEVLVIGTLDQNDEIGIKFSKEAADELKLSDKCSANSVDQVIPHLLGSVAYWRHCAQTCYNYSF